MSEQKYYVGLTSLLDENITTSYLWKDLHFYPCFEKSSYTITLKELELLTNEKLARFVGYDDQTEIKLLDQSTTKTYSCGGHENERKNL
ncbi:gp120 (endogenous virus) [Lactococcus phage KSY1]|uniref:Gp120 n=1 Tax=Lactococcus phage KSY1 TaxID=2913972 RepID=A6MAI5_9CAUD|nr:gp120 [Lactococcus phage KSY1]ABG21663.1 gp120 [Lactococcus phage KSY1]